MANENDPFADIVAEDDPFADIVADTGPVIEPRMTPLTWDERLKATLLFDDNKKRRASYMKRLGFELDPKDDNKVRPIGSQAGYDMEIDPGGLADIKQYYKKGTTEGLSELALDAVEALDSMVQGTVEEAAGVASGLTAAGVTAIPTAGTASLPAFFAGRAGGRFTMNYLLSNLKETIGDTFLDESVPVEKQDKIFKASVAAIAPEIITGTVKAGANTVGKGAGAVKDFIADRLASKRKEMQGLIRKFGGANEEFLERYAQNPTMYDPKANKSVVDNMKQTYQKIFGIDPEKAFQTKVPKKISYDSAFGQKLRPLNDEADLEIARIMKDPDAVITYGDYIEQFNPEMAPILGKVKAGESLNEAETKAINTFNDEITRLGEKAGVAQKEVVKGTAIKKLADGKETVVTEKAMAAASPEEIVKKLQDKPMSFATLENEIDVLQDKTFTTDAFGRQADVPEVAMVAGRLRRYRDEIANRSFKKAQDEGQIVNRPLTDIKAEQSKILNAYNRAAYAGKPDTIMKAYKPQITGTAEDTISKDDMRDAMKGVDEVLGTDLEQRMKDGTFQKSIDDMHRNYAMGSSNSQAAMAEIANDEMKKQAAIGSTLGALAGSPGGIPGSMVGTAVGTAIGGLRGRAEGKALGATLATPRGALDAISENVIEERLMRAGADRAREFSSNVTQRVDKAAPVINPLIQSLRQEVETPLLDLVQPTTKPQEYDPFADF